MITDNCSNNKFTGQFAALFLSRGAPGNCSFMFQGEVAGLPMQIGNKTECALLGLVIDLGVDYRQVGGVINYISKIISFFGIFFPIKSNTFSRFSSEKKCLTQGSEKSTLSTRPENP